MVRRKLCVGWRKFGVCLSMVAWVGGVWVVEWNEQLGVSRGGDRVGYDATCKPRCNLLNLTVNLCLSIMCLQLTASCECCYNMCM